METIEKNSPWEHLELLVDAADVERMEQYLDTLPAGETARAVLRLSDEDQSRLLTALAPEGAAEILQQIPVTEAVELLEELAPITAAAIVEELPSDEQADLISGLPVASAAAIISKMDPESADEIRALSQYDEHVAGGLMITEYLSYPRDWTIGQVIDDLRTNAEEYHDYEVQYAYVTDEAERLIGVLRLRDLLLASQRLPIGELMIANPLFVAEQSSLDELRDFFDRHAFFGVPVTDAAGRLVGVVRRTAVDEALGDRHASDYRRSQGLVQEELRTMPVWLRSRRRLAWLSVNILLNVVAASVIAMYQETLSAVIALAVFLPIISDMSGCSGGQAVAVSMRELALGLVKPRELARVWLKEISVGLINGLALGFLIAAVALLWKRNPYLGLVVGAAMAANTMIAVSLGGLLPLLMKLMKMDPALASGPILTTVTDMCGFFLVLSLASAMLPWLVA